MVVKTPKQYLQDAITNNTFNIEDTDRNIRMTLDHSFSYLYRLQRNMAIYEELFYTTRNVVDQPDYGDFYLGRRERVCANYPIALIPTQYREKFRVSPYYGKKIPYEEINKDHRLFTRLPVITIDDRVVRTFEFIPNDDFFTVNFGFDRYFLKEKDFDEENWEYPYVDHNVSVQVINNSDFVDIVTNTGMLKENSYDRSGFDRLKLEYIEKFGFTKKKDGEYFATIFFGEEPLGTQLIEVETDAVGDLVLRYDVGNLQRMVTYTGKVTVRLYFYRYLHKYDSFRYNNWQDTKLVKTHKIDGEIETDTFLLTDKEGEVLPVPIPTENFLIYKTDDVEDPVNHMYSTPSHFSNKNVSLTYPNIYNITSNIQLGDRFRVYYFYIHPYELVYQHLYDFIRRCFIYMWRGMNIEEIINVVRLGEFTLLPRALCPPDEVGDEYDPDDTRIRYVDVKLTMDPRDTDDIWVKVLKDIIDPDPGDSGPEDVDINKEPNPEKTTPYDNLRMLTAIYHVKRMVKFGLIPKLSAADAFWYLYEHMTSKMESIEDIKHDYIVSIGRDPDKKPPEDNFTDYIITPDVHDTKNYWMKALGAPEIKYPIDDEYVSDMPSTGHYKPTVTLRKIPVYAQSLYRVFMFLTTHPIVEYIYDEVDFIRNYSDEICAFQYKVEKFKEFIRDDYRALLNYVRVQNKVAMKYEFALSRDDLAARYRTEKADGTPFKEPMYAFPIQKIDPDNSISARIFINGLLCTTFAFERYSFTDFFYIPVTYIEDAQREYAEHDALYADLLEKPSEIYVEIEVFHYYELKHRCVFKHEEPYVDLKFPAKEFVKPTISDIYFYPGDTDCIERIDKEKFRLEFTTERYNYFVDENTPIAIYYKVCGEHGDSKKDVYYDIYGRCFSFEGQPMPDKDIDSGDVSAMLSVGKLREEVGYETDNHLTIIRLEDAVTYDRVAAGETTLQAEDDKGLLFSDITNVRVILLDPEWYDKPITVAVSKRPMFKGAKIYRVDFPQYSTPIPNYEEAQEYTRVFKNGRLISKNRYGFTDYFEGITGIQMLDQLNRGDSIGFDITPFRNRLIYYKEELDSDTIDLRGYINKPFDPQFYEVYLNGRRLNRTNLFPISPWEIKLGGLHSIYNLEIYERDRDWEYYGINFSNYYTLSDLLREPFVSSGVKTRLIRNEIGNLTPNDNCEERQPWDSLFDLYSVYFQVFYFMKLIPMNFVTGDKEQFNTDEIRKKYPIINDFYHKTNELGEDVLFLNPDYYYEPEAEDYEEIPGDERDWNVYLLGNTVTEDLEPMVDPEDDYWKGEGL